MTPLSRLLERYLPRWLALIVLTLLYTAMLILIFVYFTQEPVDIRYV